ncbi:hypothetical protein CKO25_15065 [Thiocapsa imhoffii]|uniref:Permease n=1 Tax=Thiocapsa imhoffii TaxID=382777 RepID=A0A9X0WK42_9GAMM|nr:SO_0444 family Cu/Zn efflux transporter [Thiocapsa imhoffii]MBK1645945.1 hypothetical protein [Thiocapsa imhoffii]
MTILAAILSIVLATAPWLLVGLLAAGLIKALVPEERIQQWIGGNGVGAIARAAVVGAPLPLCSCGAIPTALMLHRKGAGRGPTTAFLIGTPGIGIDSVAITFALLGPFMAIARALGAVLTAIVTGLLVGMTGNREQSMTPRQEAASACCSGACRGDARSTPGGARTAPSEPRIATRIHLGVRYAFTDLLDDIGAWILGGLVIAGIVMALVPPDALAVIGSGFGIMILMAIIGIPLYVCATAATPIALGLLSAGLSPGAALVFLLAGPMTSAATLILLQRELGTRALGSYLFGILVSTILLGTLLDWMLPGLHLEIMSQVSATQELLPSWISILSLMILIGAGVRPLRRAIASQARARWRHRESRTHD